MSVVNINSIDIPELAIYSKLSEVQLLHYREPETGIFIAESPNVIKRALAAGYEPISFLMEEGVMEGADIVEKYPEVPIYTAAFDVLTELTGFKLTRGLLCAMNRKSLHGVDEILEGCRRVVILEDVVNPTNVGAIFRSAAALNMDAVILTGGCSDPLYRRAARVSMGTVFQISWTYFSEKENKNYLKVLREKGFKTVAMALRKESVDIDDERLLNEEKLAIIMGSEGPGLVESTIDSCDYTVKIPMSHGVDSLNVAAASAVAFYVLGK